jgi:hypothetical protein
VEHAQAAEGGVEMPVPCLDMPIHAKVREYLKDELGYGGAELGERCGDGSKSVAKAGPKLEFVTDPCPFGREMTIVESACPFICPLLNCCKVALLSLPDGHVWTPKVFRLSRTPSLAIRSFSPVGRVIVSSLSTD